MRTDLTALKQANQSPALSDHNGLASRSGGLQSVLRTSASSFRSALADLVSSRHDRARHAPTGRDTGVSRSTAAASQRSGFAQQGSPRQVEQSSSHSSASTDRSTDIQRADRKADGERSKKAQDSSSDAQNLPLRQEQSDREHRVDGKAERENTEDFEREKAERNAEAIERDGTAGNADVSATKQHRDEATEDSGPGPRRRFVAPSLRRSSVVSVMPQSDPEDTRAASKASGTASKGVVSDEQGEERSTEPARAGAAAKRDAAKQAPSDQSTHRALDRAADSNAHSRSDHVRTQTASGHVEPGIDRADSKRHQTAPPSARATAGVDESRANRQGESTQQARLQERAAEQQHAERSAHRAFGEYRPDRVSAAAGRAVQVESAVRLEQATGQSQSMDASSRLANQSQQLNLASLQTGGGQQQTGHSSLGQFSGTDQPGQDGSSPRAALDDARFSGRVVRGLTAMINQRGGTMTMRLDPPDMGQLRIQMTLARGIVTAEFQAQNPQAQQMLEKNMGTLRAALESQGLTVERLNVNTQTSSQQHGMHDDGSAREQQANRHDAGHGQSRGRHDGDAANDRHGIANAEAEFDEVIEQAANRYAENIES